MSDVTTMSDSHGRQQSLHEINAKYMNIYFSKIDVHHCGENKCAGLPTYANVYTRCTFYSLPIYIGNKTCIACTHWHTLADPNICENVYLAMCLC